MMLTLSLVDMLCFLTICSLTFGQTFAADVVEGDDIPVPIPHQLDHRVLILVIHHQEVHFGLKAHLCSGSKLHLELCLLPHSEEQGGSLCCSALYRR